MSALIEAIEAGGMSPVPGGGSLADYAAALAAMTPPGNAPEYTVADYAGALRNLLPTGRAWPRDPDSTQTAVVEALAASFQRVSANANDLIEDAFPASSEYLLAEWQSTLGLPADGTALAPTLAGQQAQVIAALSSVGGASIAYFVGVAAAFGVSIGITQYRPAFTTDDCTVPIRGNAWAFSWLVTEASGNAALQAVISRFAPAHTHVVFA